jgi:hypothetical protein
MAFETFDLGRVLQTAEAIKGIRRQGEYDKIQQAYMGERIAGAQQERAQQAQTFDAENQSRTSRMHYLAAQAVENSADPVAAARQLAPEMVSEFEKQHGAGSFEQLTPDIVKQLARMGKEKSAAAAGINLQPDPNVQAQQKFTREMDATNFGQQQELAKTQHGYRLGEIEATSRVKPGNNFRPLTPEEVTQVGLPPGTSAQVDTTTGKVDVLSKRDTTATLSQKDSTTAKMKLNTLALARQQLTKIKEAYDSGTKGMNAFGPGQGMLPTEAGKLFDRRVDQMRSTLTALTRVPGVGAMSDYETKLDQAKFPNRGDYESVTADQIQNIDDMLATIENGYKGLLSGGQSQESPPDGDKTRGGPKQIQSDADYAQLPSGAQYVAPDGSTRTKR